jgi:hypothetical protein
MADRVLFQQIPISHSLSTALLPNEYRSIYVHVHNRNPLALLGQTQSMPARGREWSLLDSGA